MKKQIANFESNALSRKEMKSLNAGDGYHCKRGSCQVIIMKGAISQGRYDGYCSSSALGSLIGLNCYCETGIGQTTLTSNGGVSYCTQGS